MRKYKFKQVYYSTGYIKDVARTKRTLWYNKVEEWQLDKTTSFLEQQSDKL